MLSRLPIGLAQLQAGNNSNKLKNEIRQLLYSLYSSKNMTKQVYNNLINYLWIKKKKKKKKIGNKQGGYLIWYMILVVSNLNCLLLKNAHIFKKIKFVNE